MCSGSPSKGTRTWLKTELEPVGYTGTPNTGASPTPAPIQHSRGTAMTQGLSEAEEVPLPCLFNHPPRILYP